MSNSSIWPISGATTPSQSGQGSNDNEGVFRRGRRYNTMLWYNGDGHDSSFPKAPANWRLIIRLFRVIFKTFVRGRSHPCAEMQLVYSTTSVDWICLIKIIIRYLKPYNCVQTNENYQIIHTESIDLIMICLIKINLFNKD